MNANGGPRPAPFFRSILFILPYLSKMVSNSFCLMSDGKFPTYTRVSLSRDMTESPTNFCESKTAPTARSNFLITTKMEDFSRDFQSQNSGMPNASNESDAIIIQSYCGCQRHFLNAFNGILPAYL